MNEIIQNFDVRSYKNLRDLDLLKSGCVHDF